MAKPAFIYAFDNLGPYRFTELCGELLGSRYNGFMLGGEGADGGIDAEIDKVLGIWHPEHKDSLLNDIIQPGQTVVFQFKHKVSARIGQAQTRTQLLSLYKCSRKNICELHSALVQEKKPTSYVLVTNVEVNSQFRNTFISQCKSEEPDIPHYQVIGLDELVSWVEVQTELRHLYFPTIFGTPRFNLHVNVSSGFLFNEGSSDEACLLVEVLNVGAVPSFLNLSAVEFICHIDDKLDPARFFYPRDSRIGRIHPDPTKGLEPGRRQTYFFPLADFRHLRDRGENIFPLEVQVVDEIGNRYSEKITEEIRNLLMEAIYQEDK